MLIFLSDLNNRIYTISRAQPNIYLNLNKQKMHTLQEHCKEYFNWQKKKQGYKKI
jgi:hypothetical protein